MIQRQSISHPELMVSEDGSIYKNGSRLNTIHEHGFSIRGPVVCFWHEGKIKHLSIMRLVYEAFIKESKIQPNDYVHAIDDDDKNTHANNLVAGTRYKKKVERKTEKEPYETWMNGESELYC